MTTETILTDEVIAEALVKNGTFLSEGELSGYDKDFARAIQKAVLQSDQVQAWRKDADRFRKIINMTRAEREDVLFFACDRDVINAIDAAMEQQK